MGGLLWQAALVLQVKAQVGVANYNKLYSGFGAIPIFLVWIYMSWLIVLIGAELAASHQYEQNMRQAERLIMLRAIDMMWIRHLTDLDILREGIGLVAIGQRDPLAAQKLFDLAAR